MKFGLGQPVLREEDKRLVVGAGQYSDDLNMPNQAYAFVLRSPFGHATISALDTGDAASAPGVLGVFTGNDLEADGIGMLPAMIGMMMPLKRPDGSDMFVPPRLPLAQGTVRTIGDPVAFVVAETLTQARDAAELITVEYDELPAVTSLAEAVANGAPAVWPQAPDNICYEHKSGDAAAVDAAFETATHTVRYEYDISRVSANPMEPRAALGSYDPAADRYTLQSGVQNPHDIRKFIAQSVLKIPETKLRVVARDMGGAFGVRSNVHPELPLVLWAARKLGRPVKWTGDRSDGLLSDEHARDNRWVVELALDEDGTLLALRALTYAGMGAYLSLFGGLTPILNAGGIAGVYKTPAISMHVLAVFTNTPSIAPYRGAGRPEVSFAIECALDRAARELGFDRIEIRRRNIIPPEAMPFQTGHAFIYDSGEFERNMDTALAQADAAGFETRRAEAVQRGKLRGFGIANAIEQSAGGFEEYGQIRFDPSGGATVLVGTHNHGQGHETVFRQLLVEIFGMEFDQIRVIQGDTDQVAFGHGTFGSRSSGVGSAAIGIAGEKIIEKCKAIAAHLFEAAVEDVEFGDGEFRVAGTDKTRTFQEVAKTAFMRALLPPEIEPGLMADGVFVPPAPTFPNGCHAAEVEIDPETGTIKIERYVVVDDVGTVMNPPLLKGQVHGGVVQGIGQILMEDVVFEPGTGQLLSGSFMDYAMPRADDLSPIEVAENPVPSKTNPFGIKGAGEGGSVGAMPCMMNAIVDALAPVGVTWLEMPTTPERVWRAIRDAKGNGAG
ncbi:MAG TPA: xanthine dehydrogenase family protein molybdopterin-binding subunit [Alphaproteobacteria bacterium]|nr:xanthine dehydrogenase family protein molybdopterin-binding subunit [Alphaproteobacteria bacterium]